MARRLRWPRIKITGRWPRVILRTALGLAVLGLAVALYFYVFPRPSRLRPLGVIEVPSGKRIMVLAPHSDDEALGPGGFIAEAVRRGDDVRVVLATNGDGFRYAVEDEYHRLRLTPAQYIQFGYVRQKESLAGLKLLGVPAEKVTFLGYPDRGLARLWLDNWSNDKPYTSAYTKVAHSPYRNSFTAAATYSGESLLADLEKVLVDFKPDVVVMPHPNDAHPDHWALNAFTTYALAELSQKGEPFAQNPAVYLYLVHRGDWPAPKGAHLSGLLAPPTTLADVTTAWSSLPLSSGVTDLKYQAILQYKSQLTIMRRFLTSFARANEIFGQLGELPAVSVPDGQIRMTGTAEWSSVTPNVLDPTLDTVARRLEGSGDLRALSVAADSTHLFLLLQTRRTVSSELTYTVRLIPFDHAAGPYRPQVILRVRPPSRLTLTDPFQQGMVGGDQVAVKASRNAIEISVPLWALGSPQRVYLSAETSVANLGIDRMAWQMVRLEGRRTTGP
ncbi:MAG: PIG-L deacetylase family protein [Bacillota bacterium]